MKWIIIIYLKLLIIPVSSAETTRTATSSTICSGEQCTLTLHTGIINYWNGITYVPINTTITNSTDQLYEYMTETGEYSVYFKDSLNTAETIKFLEKGVKTTFQPMQLYWTNDLDQIHQIGMPSTGQAIPDGNKMNYTEAYGEGIDLIYYYNNDNLKEDLHISNRSVLGNPAQYIHDGGNVQLAQDFVLVTDGELIINGTTKNSTKTALIRCRHTRRRCLRNTISNVSHTRGNPRKPTSGSGLCQETPGTIHLGKFKLN